MAEKFRILVFAHDSSLYGASKSFLKIRSIVEKQREELNFLETNKQNIISNLAISKQKTNYKFL